MNKEALFEILWQGYAKVTPSAEKIQALFSKNGDVVKNDHIAIRTFEDSRVNIEVLSKPFLAAGYVEKGSYEFKAKKLFAKHFEHISDPTAPRIFISQLKTNELSAEVQNVVAGIIDEIPTDMLDGNKLILAGRVWNKPSYLTYQNLRETSEYAAWMYVNGFCANHFTVNVNDLKAFHNLQEVNSFLKQNGFKMNVSGGEIKGTPEELLEQSSVMADQIEFDFQEGRYTIPSCYYEFALRYPDDSGNLYSGFIAKSADKIFESTDFSK